MAHFVEELNAHPSVMERLGMLFETLVQSNVRVRELERLSAMSDEQLQNLGLRRDELVHRVFGDSLSA